MTVQKYTIILNPASILRKKVQNIRSTTSKVRILAGKRQIMMLDIDTWYQMLKFTAVAWTLLYNGGHAETKASFTAYPLEDGEARASFTAYPLEDDVMQERTPCIQFVQSCMQERTPCLQDSHS